MAAPEKFFVALIYFLLFGESNLVSELLNVPIDGASKELCEFRKNFTDVEIKDLTQHKYEVLEECLYYYLSAESEKKLTSLTYNIPPYDEYLQIQVDQATVKSVIPSRLRTRTTIDGKLKLSWKDTRLAYDVKRWKLPFLTIKSQYHIWVPDLKILEDEEGSESVYSGFDFFEQIHVSPEGDVITLLPYSAFAVCKEEFARYPDDHKECCFRIQSEIYTDTTKFQITSEASQLTMNEISLAWHVRRIFLDLEPEFMKKDIHTLKVCVTIERSEKTLRMELTLPLVITAILVILAPFFGSFTNQIFLKVFTLLIQFFCFQFLAQKTPPEGFGEHIPKIYKFYEFSIAITLISLIFTVIVYALSRVERKMPPPYKLSLFSSAVNYWLFCSDVPEARNQAANYASSSGGIENHTNPIEQIHAVPQVAISASSHAKEWYHVFVAMNNVFSLVVIIIYIMGLLILCA